MKRRCCIAIDLKSFYASVECVARRLDPLTARLVVADPTRTEKTICLAVSPALKAYGIPGRARLFEVVQACRKLNLDFIVAPPRMAEYMRVSSQVYGIYLRHVAPEDIHVYSVDEVFIEATEYLKLYSVSAHDFARRLISEVLQETGVTATAGIGTNLYLAKIAMDIEAKHIPADKDGVRVAELDEMLYRRKYWNHQPLTDFWRVGKGTVARLERAGIHTMGDIARWSLDARAEHLYKLFGVNAELLIDHAWGWEPCTMEAIKSYRPAVNSLSSGQVLKEAYSFAKARTVMCEMADSLALDLVRKQLVTYQIVLSVGYDRESLEGGDPYTGQTVSDYYGRNVPRPAHGSINLGRFSSSTRLITEAAMSLFDRIVDRKLLVRRMYIVASHVLREEAVPEQAELFGDAEGEAREKKRQKAILEIRRRFGKNAILKGMDFEEGATAIERNAQIGGHKA